MRVQNKAVELERVDRALHLLHRTPGILRRESGKARIARGMPLDHRGQTVVRERAISQAVSASNICTPGEVSESRCMDTSSASMIREPLAVGVCQAVVQRASRNAGAPRQTEIEIVEIAFGQLQDRGHMLGVLQASSVAIRRIDAPPAVWEKLKTTEPAGPAVRETGCAGKRRRYAALRSRTSTMVASEEIAGRAAREQAVAAAGITSSSISSTMARRPVGPCGWPQISEQP